MKSTDSSLIRIYNLLKRLWPYLRVRRRRQFGLVLILMLVSACLEVISLGAVIPFIGVLTAPEKIFNYTIVAENASIFGINSSSELVLPLTIIFSVLALMAGAVRLFVLWLNTRLAFASGAELSSEIYKRTLYQSYNVHIARNSSEIISAIVNKTSAVVHGVLFPLLLLISSLVIVLVIILSIMVVNPLVAMIVIGAFGVTYGLIVWLVRLKLHSNSKRVAQEQTQVVKALQEGLGGIRDVLLDGSQPIYCRIFDNSNTPLQYTLGNNVFLVTSPRFATETLGILLITALAFVLSQKTGGIVAALPVLGALALAAQRLLPVMQQSYAAWTTIIASNASLSDALALLEQPLSIENPEEETASLLFNSEITFDNVYFSYDTNEQWVINDVNLVIPKGIRIALVGTTGSGKSTMLDLFMGLLVPTKGTISIDGTLLGPDTKKSWQKLIAHVPQNIYLADATVAENIAFGIPKNLIDMKQVQLASEQAQISDFIINRLGGYDSPVGENGVQLSGGQRQRIGIARALYKNANILVFDEATSALDNATEQGVMASIDKLDRNITVVIVAHRLSTIQNCDLIVEIEEGKIVAQGNYKQLLECSPSFRDIANRIGVVSHA